MTSKRLTQPEIQGDPQQLPHHDSHVKFAPKQAEEVRDDDEASFGDDMFVEVGSARVTSSAGTELSQQTDDGWSTPPTTTPADSNVPRRQSAPELAKKQDGHIRRVSSLEISRPRTPVPGFGVDEDHDDGLEPGSKTLSSLYSSLLLAQAAGEALLTPGTHPYVTKYVREAAVPRAIDPDVDNWTIELPKPDPSSVSQLVSPSMTHGSSSGGKSYLGPPVSSQEESLGDCSRASEPANLGWIVPPVHAVLQRVSTKLSKLAADRDEDDSEEDSDSEYSLTPDASTPSEGNVSEEDEDGDRISETSSYPEATPSQSEENASYDDEEFLKDDEDADEDASEIEEASQDNEEEAEDLDEGQVTPQPERASTITDLETDRSKPPQPCRTVSWSGWIQEIADPDEPDPTDEPDELGYDDAPESDHNKPEDDSYAKLEDDGCGKPEDSKDETQDPNKSGDTETQDDKPAEPEDINTESQPVENPPAEEVDKSKVYPYNYRIFRPMVGELPDIWGLRDPKDGPKVEKRLPIDAATHFREHRDSIKLYGERMSKFKELKEKHRASAKAASFGLKVPRERLDSNVYRGGEKDGPEETPKDCPSN
jgi:hypothetical protein